jgi:hypothetical protein
MEGGAAAAPSGGTGVAASGDSVGTDVAVDGVGEGLTGTEQIPIPIAPYAIARYSRRYCFQEFAENCRR